jgi:protein-tyrosine phosphatase
MRAKKHLPFRVVISILFLSLVFLPQRAFSDNLHLIDRLPNGFALYRSGEPSPKDLEEFRTLGIQEIAVLSGDAEKHEMKYCRICPGLKVAYNHEQDAHKPVSAAFLRWFDNWVEEARSTGKVIAIRCHAGSHRTGRLAAYYEMKFKNLSAEQAIAEMKKLGKQMFFHRDLDPQVRALEDFVLNRQCAQHAAYYPIEGDEDPGVTVAGASGR